MKPGLAQKRLPSLRWPDLFKKNSGGAIQVWRVRVDPEPDGSAWIVTEHGLVDGKLLTHSDRVTSGKSVGTKAETTPLEQAGAEAKSKWTAQKARQGYVETIEDAHAGARDLLVKGGIEPMLAHTYGVLYRGVLTRDKASAARWPADAQPKLDGHRLIATVKNGRASLWSRKREEITGLPHIVRALEAAFPAGEWIIDGEAYNHEFAGRFEELSGYIASKTPKPGYEVVEYHVYDVAAQPGSATSKLPWRDRKALLRRHLGSAPRPLVLVETIEVRSEAELLAAMKRWVKAGYEGAILRNLDGLYANRRTGDLLKLKEFYDAEFRIVGVVEGRGAMKGLAIFVCETPATAEARALPGAKPRMPGGVEFKAKMVGKLSDLAVYWEHPETCIGKTLTVKYQGFFASGAPRIAVALRLREDA